MFKSLLRIAVGAALIAATTGSSARPIPTTKTATSAIRLGVYYYPGWYPSAWTAAKAWHPIEAYPDRKPLLDWYDPRSPAILRQQIAWMRDYAIDYVVFDWTYSHGSEHLGEVIDTYLGLNQTAVKFSILWANHDQPTSRQEMRAIVQTWLSRYMPSGNFLKVDGKPVVFIFSFQKFRDDALGAGSSAKAYIADANAMARQAGLPGIYFIGGVDDTSSDWVKKEAIDSGIGAISTYNFHRKPEIERNRDPAWGQAFHGYSGLDSAYRAQWAAAKTLPVPFVVPMSSGWDKRPWGGSDDPKHDRSIGDKMAFRAHLMAGRKAILATGGRPKLGVICCWNEYGEGSFIEPTQANRFDKLDQVKAVFGRR